MMGLETDYAWVYHNFIENGYHIPFNIQTDLITEQVMIKSLKRRGGITKRCGVTEFV